MNKVTDNVELDFPARMADGRLFTDYKQNCLLNNRISKGMGSFEYKNYLTQNAESIRQNMISVMEQNTACTKCSDNTVLPVKTVMNCNPEGCNYQINNMNGLGKGINYQ
tara:strand:- start:1335 stop:1661 length:327 start_codon:yes stop_codon:yes gene_type:complete